MTESSRNSPHTNSAGTQAEVSFYEKHKKIYIRDVKGWWNSWRWVLVWVTQILFYCLPWLEWNGRQALLLHLVERKFYLFGLVLWPQDVFYLALLLIVSAYALFLFTAIAGRLFCGYACPQTVYTEIFMWVENRIEGDRSARMKLDKAPMTVRKFGLKAFKHAIWLLISLWTGFTLVAYFTPVNELLAALPFGFSGWELFWTFFYGAFCYMQAGFLREQVCKYMCPYARFQGVMFDPDTLIITYDPERGEPRGARKKGVEQKDSGLGDCVDCGLCVVVCPTGIDIRKGQQYECIGCGACIDVCDPVMDKLGFPRGLIRYTTENALEKHFTSKEVIAHLVRPRIILYTVILTAITIAAIWSLAVRVTMMLMEPMIDEAPMICMAKIAMSMPGPIWVDSGAYRVQPAAVAPPGTRKEPTSSNAAGGSSQNEKLFMRANAMSEAPICSGIIQLAKPTKAGMIAPNTIIRPCIVTN